MYTNKKPIIMAVLCVLVVVMAIGFALLSQNLTITGTSHIDSNWNIRITNIQVQETHSAYQSGTNASADVSGSTGCTTQTASNNGCGTTTANFETKLVTPGDYVIYRVTITNSGTLDGVVESINLTCSENDAIICTTTGLSRAATIAKNGGTNTVDVKVEYNSATTTQPVNTNSTATLTINYQQDLGQVAITYPTYSIGDDVTFGGSNWKVIKNSTAQEDYVTLMKETVLTASEIGDAYSIKVNDTGQPYMAYYWSSTCHQNGTFGTDTYNSSDGSGCDGHNDYAGSKIKQVVDNYMTNYLDESKLKALDGYKIRLITLDELIDNLGFSPNETPSSVYYGSSGSTPSWVYNNLGNGESSYWTMSPDADVASQAWYVTSRAQVFSRVVQYYYDGSGVRPVINLLKPAN